MKLKIAILTLHIGFASTTHSAELGQVDDSSTFIDIISDAASVIQTAKAEFLAEKAKTESDLRYAHKYEPYAVNRYTSDQYPKTMAEFWNRLPEVERFKWHALRKAINNPKCNIVTTIELSTKSSIGHLIYWADCQNGQRLWFDEDEFRPSN